MSTLAKEPITYNVGKNLPFYHQVELGSYFHAVCCFRLNMFFRLLGVYSHLSSVNKV